MFWLFKRKKVSDKRAITPCVCDNGNQLQDTYTLQDFGGPSESGNRKGYHKLEIPPDEEEEPSRPTAEVNYITSSSTESSEDFDNVFGEFANTDDEEEELTCNVCERSFGSVRRLEQHQQRQRHYGCSICDAVFPNLMALEMHKETLDHWSDYELRIRNVHEESEDDLDSDDEPEEHRVYSRRSKDELKKLLL